MLEVWSRNLNPRPMEEGKGDRLQLLQETGKVGQGFHVPTREGGGEGPSPDELGLVHHISIRSRILEEQIRRKGCCSMLRTPYLPTHRPGYAHSMRTSFG